MSEDKVTPQDDSIDNESHQEDTGIGAGQDEVAQEDLDEIGEMLGEEEFEFPGNETVDEGEEVDGNEPQPQPKAKAKKESKQEESDDEGRDENDLEHLLPEKEEGDGESEDGESEDYILQDLDGSDQKVTRLSEDTYIPVNGKAVRYEEHMEQFNDQGRWIESANNMAKEYFEKYDAWKIDAASHIEFLDEEIEATEPSADERRRYHEPNCPQYIKDKVNKFEDKVSYRKQFAKDVVQKEKYLREGGEKIREEQREYQDKEDFRTVQKKYPIMRDPVKAQQLATEMGKYALKNGFSQERLQELRLDEPMFTLFQKAMSQDANKNKSRMGVRTQKKSSAGMKPKGGIRQTKTGDIYDQARERGLSDLDAGAELIGELL